MQLMVIAGVLVALAAATRGMWSPCGLSMLTSINPVAERGRRHRYSVTAAWFILGGALGGLTLGMVAALLAVLVAAVGLSIDARVAIGAGAALLAVLVDQGAVGVEMPVLRRQVNERWLDEFRGWFYGVGFGWQIGVGVATYVMTAAVGLTVVVASLSGRPAVAVAICVLFGFVRGSWVLLTARVRSAEELRGLLRQIDRLEEPVRRGVIGLELVVAAALGLWLSVWLALGVLAVAAVAMSATLAKHRSLKSLR